MLYEVITRTVGHAPQVACLTLDSSREGGSLDPLKVLVDESPDTPQEAETAFYTLLVPFEALLGRRGEQREQTRRIGTVSPDKRVGVDHVLFV